MNTQINKDNDLAQFLMTEHDNKISLKEVQVLDILEASDSINDSDSLIKNIKKMKMECLAQNIKLMTKYKNRKILNTATFLACFVSFITSSSDLFFISNVGFYGLFAYALLTELNIAFQYLFVDDLAGIGLVPEKIKKENYPSAFYIAFASLPFLIGLKANQLQYISTINPLYYSLTTLLFGGWLLKKTLNEIYTIKANFDFIYERDDVRADIRYNFISGIKGGLMLIKRRFNRPYKFKSNNRKIGHSKLSSDEISKIIEDEFKGVDE